MSLSRENVPTLQRKIDEKDDLIAALTAQLEKTVEQLDRVRRSGADRFPSLSAPSSEQLRGHDELTSRVESALSSWTDLRPEERILKIESGVDQILQMLQSGTVPRSAPVSHATPEKRASDDSFWQAAKARLMKEAGADEEKQTPPPVATSSSTETVIFDDVQQVAESDIPIPPAPSPVEPDADPAILWQGIELREAHLQYLTARLRIAESKCHPSPDWEALNNAPQELVTRVMALEASLKEQLRQAEIAHSLERAALTRERARLSQVKQQLEAHIRRIGGTGNSLPPAAPTSQPPTEKEKSQDADRRWSRLFSK